MMPNAMCRNISNQNVVHALSISNLIDLMRLFPHCGIYLEMFFGNVFVPRISNYDFHWILFSILPFNQLYHPMFDLSPFISAKCIAAYEYYSIIIFTFKINAFGQTQQTLIALFSLKPYTGGAAVNVNNILILQ